MLRDRLLSSTVLISITVALLWLDVRHPLLGVAGVWLLPLVIFFALGTAADLTKMLRANGRELNRRFVIVTTAIVALSPCVPMLWPIWGQKYPDHCPIGTLGWVVISLVTVVFLLLLHEICVYQSGAGKALERTLCGAFVSVYVGVPMALLVMLRQLGTSETWGLAALVTMVAVTKSCDAGAYFTGKSLGRRKLIPHLSPGKTWEGAAGGIATSVIVSYACCVWLIPVLSIVTKSPPWWGPIIFGVVCAVSGMIGDLAESLIKRETGVKDSGNWLPGLGGVWDVTDSLIGSVMPAWVMLAAGLAGS